MVKKIQVIGAEKEEGTIMLAMGENSLIVKTDEPLTAKNLYDFLCYERGDNYEVDCVGKGRVQKGVYESFCKLIEDIATKLSSIELKEIEEGEDIEQDELGYQIETQEDTI